MLYNLLIFDLSSFSSSSFFFFMYGKGKAGRVPSEALTGCSSWHIVCKLLTSNPCQLSLANPL